MSIAYKVVGREMKVGDSKGKTVYYVRPASYGLLTTDDAARQIAEESASTAGDVKSVLDRYAYYVKENLRKGYNIELLGCGTLFTRFVTKGSASTKDEANASLVKSMIPGFRASFKLASNGSRVYDLIPTKIGLVKFGDDSADADDSGSSASSDSGSGSGSSTGSSTGSDSGSSSSDSGSSSSDTGSGTFQG